MILEKSYQKKEVREKCTGGMDTNQIYDLDNNVIGLSVGKKEFPVDSVYQFQLLEEIFFDKEASKLVRRIIAIAPMGPLVVNGTNSRKSRSAGKGAEKQKKKKKKEKLYKKKKK